MTRREAVGFTLSMLACAAVLAIPVVLLVRSAA